MTNAQIIALEKITRNIPDDVDIHTFQAWKALGFSVKKGEKSDIKFQIWEYTKAHEDKDGNTVPGKCYMRMSSFFTNQQVEPLTERKPKTV